MLSLFIALGLISQETSPCLKGSILKQGKQVELLYCNASTKVFTVKQETNLNSYPIEANKYLTCQCVKEN
jgi:hypothetical protein